MDRKVVVAFFAALVALIVVGFVAMNFVPTTDLIDVNITGDIANMTENATVNLSDDPIDTELNITDINTTEINDTSENDTAEDNNDDVNDTNSSSDSIDAGDVLHKQTFTISENETGQNQGMEPGKYVMYYTENDGIIKVEKID